MKIYMAAMHSNGYRATSRYDKLNQVEKDVVNSVPYMLESYHYIHKQKYVDEIREYGDTVFLDSGAFSAKSLGITLSLEKYCDYIKKNGDIIAQDDGIMLASVLDGIGDALGTYRNQLEMEARGVKPLPCFHLHEDPRYLDHYIANYEYITLGGLVRAGRNVQTRWLDRIWEEHLIDGSGNPRLKVHGFGVTSRYLMERYPWYSCDSSTWIQNALFGMILSYEHGLITISEKSPTRHRQGAHYCNFSPPEQEYVSKMLEGQGFNVERLATVYESRAAYNIRTFRELERSINEEGRQFYVTHKQELFSSYD